MNRLIELIVILVLLISCEKQDPSPDRVSENSGPLISREKFGEDLRWICEYDEANLPAVVKTKWTYTLYFYDEDNQLTGYDVYEDQGIYSSNWQIAQAAMNRTEWVNPANTEKSLHATLSYHEGNTSSITISNYINQTTRTIGYEFDVKGQVVKETYESGHVEYVYNSLGNLIQRKQYHEGVLWVMKEYEFDSHPNPFFVFRKLLQPGKYTNRNNITREKTTLYTGDGSIESEYTEEFSYEYNTQGYPVKKDNVTYLY